MSAAVTAATDGKRSNALQVSEPIPAQALTIVLSCALLYLIVSDVERLARDLTSAWPALVFWTAMAMTIDLFPLNVGQVRLTLDMPILLTVAILYSPGTAAFVALAGALDLREVKKQIKWRHAIFNRVQIALSIWLASSTFHLLSAGISPWITALAGTATALAVDYVSNVSLVSLRLVIICGQSFWTVVRSLTVGNVPQFLATYLGYGVLALVLAHLYADVGAWATLTLLLPILVARQMLVRGQQLQALAKTLGLRERMVERLGERILDERKDERFRIAGELHDDVLQSLMQLWFLGKYVETSRASGPDEYREVVEVTERALESLRDIIHDLRKSPLGRGGLFPTLRGLITDLRLDWHVEIVLDLPERIDMGPKLQLVLYQVAREAVLNALRHGTPSRIRVRIAVEGHDILLAVEDDGTGFDSSAIDTSTHFGIGLMRERLRSLGGRLEIDSERGQGTRLTASVPLDEDLVSLAPTSSI